MSLAPAVAELRGDTCVDYLGSAMLAVVAARLVEVYALIGVVVGGWFALRAAPRLDPAARGASLALRLLLWPGAAALWPWVLVRARRGASLPVESTAHRRAERAPS